MLLVNWDASYGARIKEDSGDMADLFISHSHADASVAAQLAVVLEGKGLSTWIAPRDIPAGTHRPEEIVKGLEDCRALVLLFSGNPIDSPQVVKELGLAAHLELPIFPIRTDGTAVSSPFSNFLAGTQFLDARADSGLSTAAEAIAGVLSYRSNGGESRVPGVDGGDERDHAAQTQGQSRDERLAQFLAAIELGLMLANYLASDQLPEDAALPMRKSLVVSMQPYVAILGGNVEHLRDELDKALSDGDLRLLAWYPRSGTAELGWCKASKLLFPLALGAAESESESKYAWIFSQIFSNLLETDLDLSEATKVVESLKECFGRKDPQRFLMESTAILRRAAQDSISGA